jgi:hypothetical protein
MHQAVTTTARLVTITVTEHHRTSNKDKQCLNRGKSQYVMLALEVVRTPSPLVGRRTTTDVES